MIRSGVLAGWAIVALTAVSPSVGQQPESTLPARTTGRVAERVLDQPARLSLPTVPLPDALTRLQQASGASIVFSPSRLPQGASAACSCAAVSVGEALHQILQGTGFRFREVGGQVIVFSAAEPGASPPGEAVRNRSHPEGAGPGVERDTLRGPAPPPTAVVGDAARPDVGVLSGRITGAKGEPLEGARVLVVGTPQGGTTGPGGEFLIRGVPSGPHAVRATFPGYEEGSRWVVLNPERPAEIVLPLRSQVVHLAGVVAIGYGTARRKDLTGSIGSVPVHDALVEPTASVGQMLEGRVAGAQVIQNNGAPGGGIAIRVRGTASVSASSEPLYVVDGIPAFSVGRNNSAYANPLAAINPYDIASIEVLKDASSTAIYGSRGAAGVVLVTTKQGERGQDRLSMESTYGVQSPEKYLSMLNATQFAQEVNDARANAMMSPIYSALQMDSIRALNGGTDWQRLVMRNAPMQSHSLTFSGGDEKTRYLLSGSYYDQKGIIIGSDFVRYSGRVNLDRTLSSRLLAGTTLTVSSVDQNLQATDNGLANGAAMGALWFNPVAGPRNADGSWLLYSPVTWPATNPVAIAEEDLNHQTGFHVIGGAYAEYRLLEALRLRSSLGLTSSFGRTDVYSPRTSPNGWTTNGIGSAVSVQSSNLTNENTAMYARDLGPGTLDLLGGFTVQTSRVRTTTAGNSQFVNDLTGVENLGAGTIPTVGTNLRDWALLSVLGRANYNLLDRYLFTFTGRRDGSSRFGANSKWGFFPSAAFAWRLVDEPFMQDQSVFSDLKLRLSYGVTGNQEIGLYQSLARLATTGYSIGGAAAIGFAPDGAAPNPDLKWETTKQYNGGLDWGFLGNRVTGSVDAYHSVTHDLLLGVTLPATSGFSSQLRNVGSVENDGVELELSTTNFASRRVSWRSALTFAHNRNRVIDLGVSRALPISDQKGVNAQTGQDVLVMMVGQPLGTFVGKKTDGLYQPGDACPLKVLRPRLDCVPGEYKYVDSNGDGKIDANDNVVLGNGQPDFYGGLSNTVKSGPFEVSAFLQFSQGGEVLNAPAINMKNVNTFSNQTVDALRRWTPANTNTSVPRANADRPREVYDVHIEDGSYLRLQTVTLAYQVPPRLIPSSESARVYVTGQNLKVWTKYTGFDPEVNSFGADATAPGVDAGSYPKARSYSVGVNVAF
jgi:TonB-linked SusC/RagA family outer membrane protein